MQDFKKLIVWQKSHALMLAIHEVSESFPPGAFSFTNQIRDSSMSVPFNIAEGAGKSGDLEFNRYIRIALGSTCEMEAQLITALDLKYLAKAGFESLNSTCTEVRKMLISLSHRLTQAHRKPRGRIPTPTRKDRKEGTSYQ